VGEKSYSSITPGGERSDSKRLKESGSPKIRGEGKIEANRMREKKVTKAERKTKGVEKMARMGRLSKGEPPETG